MAKQMSENARAAKMVRQELKARGIKGRVTSRQYSMGSSMDVVILEDVNPEIYESVKEYARQFQFGHFDGMQDLYEYSNSRDDIPQVKHVFTRIEYSDELKQRVWNYIRNVYANMEDAPEQLEESYNFYSKNWGASAVGMVNRILFDSEGVAWNGELQA